MVLHETTVQQAFFVRKNLPGENVPSLTEMRHMLLYAFIPHIHVLGKGVHGHTLVADDSTRRPCSVVLLHDVVNIPDMQSKWAGKERMRS